MDYMKEAKEMARNLAINYLEEPMEIKVVERRRTPYSSGLILCHTNV